MSLEFFAYYAVIAGIVMSGLMAGADISENKPIKQSHFWLALFFGWLLAPIVAVALPISALLKWENRRQAEEAAPEAEEMKPVGFRAIGGSRDGLYIGGSPAFLAMARDGLKVGEYTMRTQPDGELCFVVEGEEGSAA